MWVRVFRGVTLAIVGALIVMSGCSSGKARAKPPLPQIMRAPAEAATLSVYVHRLVTPPATPEDHWDYKHMPGLTRGLRQAFQVALTRAGYRVVVGRREPRDLVAMVQADWPKDRAGVASVTISAGARVIDQLSAEIPVVGKGSRLQHLEGHAAVSLVNALNRSPALVAYARERMAPPPPAQIAEPLDESIYEIPDPVPPPPPAGDAGVVDPFGF